MNKNTFKKIISNGCIYFAVVSICIFLIYIVFSDSIYAPSFSVFRMLALLGFCFAFAAANCVLSVERLNGAWKLLLHASITLGSFLIFVYAPLVGDGKYQNAAYVAPNILVLIGIFAIVYAAGYGLYIIVSSKKNAAQNAKKEYKPVYNKKNKEPEYNPLFKDKK